MNQYLRAPSETLDPDTVLEQVTQITCDAIDDSIVAYSEHSGSFGRFLEVPQYAKTVVVDSGTPEDCPLRSIGNRDSSEFAKACGSCTLAHFIY